ncbi:MAG: DedA family protein [Ruthenibacterium lactatiformans]
MTPPGVILFSTLGSVAGAIVLYGVGRLLAPQRLEALLSGRVGRVLKMESADVHKASDWFAAHGWPSVFYCRCIPILRSLISIPAGMAHIHAVLLLTTGQPAVNILLVHLGALAGQSWLPLRPRGAGLGWVKAVLVVVRGGVSALFTGGAKREAARQRCAGAGRNAERKIAGGSRKAAHLASEAHRTIHG